MSRGINACGMKSIRRSATHGTQQRGHLLSVAFSFFFAQAFNAALQYGFWPLCTLFSAYGAGIGSCTQELLGAQVAH